MKIYRFDKIDSTNEFLKKCDGLEERDVVIAKVQTAGKGRRGNSWVSLEGAGLFSFVLKEDEKIAQEEYLKLPLLVGYSLLKTLRRFEDLDYKFKWTNDIYLNEKKLSGILIEKIENNYIIGIGININNQIPEKIKEIAISLNDVTEKIYNLEEVIFTIIEDFFGEFERFKIGEWFKILKEINEKNYLFGKRIDIVYGKIKESGLAGEILKNGELEVFLGNQVKSYNVGEIHISRESKG